MQSTLSAFCPSSAASTPPPGQQPAGKRPLWCMQMDMTYVDRGKNLTNYLVAGSKEGTYAASFKRYRVKPLSKPEEPRAILSIGWLRDCYEAKKVSD